MLRIVSLVLSLCCADTALAATLLAHSVNDWDAARQDGIGVAGVPVVPGSAADAPQAGHADTSGLGSWRYISVHSPTGGSFGGAPIVLTDWRDGIGNPPGYYHGFRVMSRDVQHPTPEISGDQYAVREWTASGLQGQQLRLFGEFSTLFNNIPHGPGNNGIQAVVVVDSVVHYDQSLLPGNSIAFDFLVTALHPQTTVRFVVGTNARAFGATINESFFNDSTQVLAQIAVVPLPASAMLLVAALPVLVRRRRRT